jgi:proteic killer suppression protein
MLSTCCRRTIRPKARDFDQRVAAMQTTGHLRRLSFDYRHALMLRSAAFASGISSGYERLAMRIPMGYVLLMIRSFKGTFAEPILQGRMVPKGFPANLAKVARRKLIMVDSAAFLEALNSPPGNRLKALKGDFAGKHSVRINDQWRIVFRWTDAGPEDVEIIDYH